jgi:hypothetical protein
MKMKFCSLMILCSALFLTSCSKDGSNGVDGTNGTNGTNGKDGANGKDGVNGTNGTNGTNGKTALTRTTKEPAGANCKYGGTKFETGIDANNNGILDNNEVTATQTKYVCDGAGAIYSSWIDVKVSDTSKLEEEGAYDYKQLLPAEALTADIANNGLVLMYYKSKNGVITSVDRDDMRGIRDVTATGTTFQFQAGYVFKEKYLSFLTNDDRMNDNGSTVRYVLIPGMVQGRSMTDLQQMPYSEVAKLYNIKD